MAKAAPRNYCKLDVMIWNHSGMRKLPDSAALAYIYLIAWSKCMKKDGHFDSFAMQQCGASAEDLAVLVTGGFVMPKEGEDGVFSIPTFEGWQVTTGEEGVLQENSRMNGAKGGRRASVEKDTREEWLKIAHGGWPEPTKGYYENPDNVRLAFYQNVTTEDEWEKFKVVLTKRIAVYESDPQPVDTKRRFLGSFQKFCSSWRDAIEETSEKIVVAPTPVVKKEPKPFTMVVEEE